MTPPSASGAAVGPALPLRLVLCEVVRVGVPTLLVRVFRVEPAELVACQAMLDNWYMVCYG